MPMFSLSSSQRVAARSILAILGAAMLVSACSRPAPPEEPVRSVKVITVGLGAFESGQEYAGEVRARVESRLGFRVAGKITKRTVEVGQRALRHATLRTRPRLRAWDLPIMLWRALWM